MDKVMSTRMDEGVIHHIAFLAKKLGTSKKSILENAIRCYAQKVGEEADFDALKATFGGWNRSETAVETVRSIKNKMRHSQERYKR